MTYKEITSNMLRVDDYTILHWNFIEYLDEIAGLTGRECGSLVSRQAIALAIVTWQRMNPDKRIIGNG